MVNKTSKPCGSPGSARFWKLRSKTVLLLIGASVLCLLLIATNTFSPASATDLGKLQVDSSVLDGGSQTVTHVISSSTSSCQVAYTDHLQCRITLSVPAVSWEQVRWNAVVKNRMVARLTTISPGYGTLAPGEQVEVTIQIRGSGGLFPIFFVGSHNTVKVMCLCERE